MVMTNETPYNQFSNLSQVPYSIISYLMTESELLWKLLNNNSATAWNDANLTQDEKAAIIYDGIRNPTDCRVFMNTGLDDSWLKETTILRVSVINGIPNNRVWGTMLIAFDIFSHYAVSTLSNYSPRDLAISQELFKVLNESEIPGLGKLYFDARATSRCQLSAIGQIPYRGITIVMATKSLG
jgi:hypothetical protein